MVYRFGRFSDAAIIEDSNRRARPIVAPQQVGILEESGRMNVATYDDYFVGLVDHAVDFPPTATTGEVAG